MGSLTPTPPPIIDISPFYGGDEASKQNLVNQIRDACLAKGFFQIINHNIPFSLQQAVLAQSADLFDLPVDEKLKYDKASNPHNRGYETLGSQNFEKRGNGDLKEGFYFGNDLAPDHPSTGKFNMGPNIYPTNVTNPAQFQSTIDTYIKSITSLAHDILSLLALTLSLPATHFEKFSQNPIATLRLLHYPPQPPTSLDDPDYRGCGAHTDFGSVTLLLQDNTGGLQVYDHPSDTWIDVVPIENAFVINLGNLMMRWSNDKYISNLHRVINKSGRERYSIPFFFNGDPDFVVECLPGCEGENGKRKYEPIKVESYLRGRYADTYGSKKGETAVADPVSERRT